jgi:hypothetical protein
MTQEETKVYYTTYGSVCGDCGHKHRTIETAARCAAKHSASIRRYNGQHSYSDRRTVRWSDWTRKGDPLTPAEQSDLQDIQCREGW